MMNDPLIDEIRRVRCEISDELGPDLIGFVEHYAKIETRFVKPAITAEDHNSNRVKKITDQSGQREASAPALP
jgi:hypothetical protein